MPKGVSWTIIVAVLVSFLVLSILGYFARRKLQQRDDKANEDSGTERAARKQQRSTRIPLRTRMNGMTPEGKAIAIAACLILVTIVVNVWQYMKTGSPTQMAYAQETQVVLATLVGGFLFVRYDRKRRKHFGVLRIEHEADPEDDQSETTPETIHFDTRDVIETEDGLVVHEYTKGGIFGLFRRAKRVADDPTLRDDDDVYRPLDDKIGHLVPERATEFRDNVYVFRSKGSRPTKSPDTVEDIQYKPAYSMSREERARVNADMDMMRTDLREQSHQIAHKDAKIRTLEQKVDNLDNAQWTRFLAFAERLAPLFGRGFNQQQVLQKLDDGLPTGHTSRNGDGSGGDDLLPQQDGQSASRGES